MNKETLSDYSAVITVAIVHLIEMKNYEFNLSQGEITSLTNLCSQFVDSDSKEESTEMRMIDQLNKAKQERLHKQMCYDAIVNLLSNIRYDFGRGLDNGWHDYNRLHTEKQQR